MISTVKQSFIFIISAKIITKGCHYFSKNKDDNVNKIRQTNILCRQIAKIKHNVGLLIDILLFKYYDHVSWESQCFNLTYEKTFR